MGKNHSQTSLLCQLSFFNQYTVKPKRFFGVQTIKSIKNPKEKASIICKVKNQFLYLWRKSSPPARARW